ncbi:growth regulator [Aquitalea sp.]|uniref:AbrB/MazE/SpoVT family DNA-binding domain-containing protein n=1 Tax=Aquitalea sp. TaxID=1872623 RepID=UPI00258A49F3|nr:growth regulator [Aquitalea sp.]
MKAMLRKMGNSQGIIIPKALITQFGFDGEVEMTVTPEGIMLAKPKEQVRAGWAAASQALAEAGDDGLVYPEFGNEGDEALKW